MEKSQSIERAEKWLKAFEALFEKKFGGNKTLVFSKDRTRYWQFLVNGVEKVKNDKDPVTRLICLVGIGKHANCGMLPPGDPAVDDSKIPFEISRAIHDLPPNLHRNEPAIRDYLKDHAYFVLCQNNKSIGFWLANELDYWKKDFAMLAAELGSKLNLTENEYQQQRQMDERKEEERAKGRDQSIRNFMTNIQNNGGVLPQTMEGIHDMLRVN